MTTTMMMMMTTTMTTTTNYRPFELNVDPGVQLVVSGLCLRNLIDLSQIARNKTRIIIL